jgi:hypothetical protein
MIIQIIKIPNEIMHINLDGCPLGQAKDILIIFQL